MKNRLKLIAGIVVLALLVTGGYYVYAADGHDHDKHKGGPGAQSSSADKSEANDDPNSPAGLLKTADKILGDVSKSKPPKADRALMEHSEKMLAEVFETVRDCNKMLAGDNPDTAKVSTMTESSIKLTKKSVELMSKYHMLMLKTAEKTSGEKTLYACPMGCITPQDKPGNCSKCGMNLVKKEPTAKAAYACPMGCATSDKPGKCPKCGMNLEKKN